MGLDPGVLLDFFSELQNVCLLLIAHGQIVFPLSFQQ